MLAVTVRLACSQQMSDTVIAGLADALTGGRVPRSIEHVRARRVDDEVELVVFVLESDDDARRLVLDMVREAVGAVAGETACVLISDSAEDAETLARRALDDGLQW